MKIQTKFNIGQMVWFMFLDEPFEVKITGIVIGVHSDGDIRIRYYVGRCGSPFYENTLYSDKISLLKTLS